MQMMSMLLGALALAAVQAPPADAAADQKQICKQKPVTGSRTKYEKVCMTASEWRTRRENNGRTLREAEQQNGAYRYPGTTGGD
jgi:hypothetical protein